MPFLARTVINANGVQAAFPLSFPYQYKTDVQVYVHLAGSTALGAPKLPGVDFDWTSASTITFRAAAVPAAGQVVDMRRFTTNSKLDNNMQPGGSLQSGQLVQNDTQQLYLAQEALDTQADYLALLTAETSARAAADLVLQTSGLKGDPGSPGEGYASTAALQLKLNTATSSDDLYLSQFGVWGKFIFYSAAAYLAATGRSLTADVALDPSHSVFLPAQKDATGASGAAIRVEFLNAGRITPYMFGASFNDTVNSLTQLQAFNDFAYADQAFSFFIDWTGDYGVAGTLNIGPSVAMATNGKRPRMGGELRLNQLTDGTQVTCAWRNLNTCLYEGRVTYQGRGGPDFASRTNAIGATFTFCPLTRFTGGHRAFNFWLDGLWLPGTQSNDQMSLGQVRTYYCGSGFSGATYSLLANWSTIVRTGATRSTAQRDQLTLDVLPDVILDTYKTVGTDAIYVRLPSGNIHYVYAWNRGAKTISLWPWLSAADYAAGAGSGALTWIFGESIGFVGADSGITLVDHLHAIDCGIGFQVGALYGPRVSSANVSSCGVAVAISKNPTASSIGLSADAFYTESCDTDILITCAKGNNFYGSIHSTYALDLSKCQSLGSLDTATDARIDSGFGGAGSGTADSPRGGLIVAAQGLLYTNEGRPVTNLLSATATFRDHNRPRRLLPQFVDTQTVSLSVQGAGEYNRLFGIRGGTWRFVGSGVNGEPTGSIIISPSQTFTGTLTNGSPTVAGVGAVDVGVGMGVTGTGVPGGATVLSVNKSANTVTLSANATASGAQTLTFNVTSINGVAAPAAITFAGFDGPADFEFGFSDTAQLVWTVRCVSGRSRLGYRGIATKGDANFSLSSYTDKIVQRVTAALTADRAVTLQVAGAIEGNEFSINRIGGAFNLNVSDSAAGLLKAMAANAWADYKFDGAQWREFRNGLL